MINHPVREEILKLGSLVVYYFWEIDPKHLSRAAVKKFFWHDNNCVESIGPFKSLTHAMSDYSKIKKEQKALQGKKVVQELHETGLNTLVRGVYERKKFK